MPQSRLRPTLPLLGALALFALAPGATADTLVVPAALQNAPGNASNAFPFSKTSLFPNRAVRYQQVYASSEFTGPGQPITITELRFRIDELTGDPAPVVITDIVVHLSTTSKAVDALDATTFDNNVGADDTLVFSGTLNWDACGAGSDPCVGSPRPFDLPIALTTPFFYDPNAGNLLLEVLNNDTTPVLDYLLDQDVTQADPISRVIETVDPQDQHQFSQNTGGLPTQFVYTVPEPAAAGAAFAALTALATLARRRLA